MALTEPSGLDRDIWPPVLYEGAQSVYWCDHSDDHLKWQVVVSEEEVQTANAFNALKRLLAASWPFPFVVLLREVIKGLVDRAHVRGLVVID